MTSRPDAPDPDGSAPEHVVAIDVSEAECEVMADRLFSLGASAVSEQRLGQGTVTLVADLGPSALEELLGAGVAGRVLEPEPAWDDGWREHARTWHCGQRLVLRPAWVAPRSLRDDEVELVVEPGRAFGTGSHPTTRLCLAALEPLVERGDSVLDVGCGTGVLGVAAALLGASRVEAIDIDPEAVRITREVAVINGMADRVHVSSTPLQRVRGVHDLVLANLLIPIVEALGAGLVERLAPESHLVVSGILDDQRDRALAALAGTELFDEHREDGWIALVLRRAPAGSEVAGLQDGAPG